mmetsp:Transcript_67815/g.153366  ORF Transcript_67815/g.153366 Transcript_67815/m.153366 type:complete len:257 (-) Transcript_67815:344-1114(-)
MAPYSKTSIHLPLMPRVQRTDCRLRPGLATVGQRHSQRCTAAGQAVPSSTTPRSRPPSGDNGVVQVGAAQRAQGENEEDDESQPAVHTTELGHHYVLLVNDADLPAADADEDAVVVGAWLHEFVIVAVLVAGVGLCQQVGRRAVLEARDLDKVGGRRWLALDDVANLRSGGAAGPVDPDILFADKLDVDQAVLVGRPDLHVASSWVDDAVLLELPSSVPVKLALVDGLPGHDEIVWLDLAVDVVALALRLNLLLQS